MIIQGSIFGANADTNQWSNFSCRNADGTRNAIKSANYDRLFSNMGCNFKRIIPFLTVDKNYTGTEIQRNIQPFVFEDRVYNHDKFNQQYFNNLKEDIKSGRRHNMGSQVVIFEDCHGHQKQSCWMLNNKRTFGWYDFNKYARAYVKKILKTIEEARSELIEEGYNSVDILFELENEPQNDGFLHSGIETLKMLLEAGYKYNQIELGVFYIGDKIKYNKEGKLILTPLFEKFKKAMRKAEPPLYDGSQKDEYFSTIHDFGNNQEKLDEILKAVTHTRRLSLSNDGQKPKADSVWWYHATEDIFKRMKKNNVSMKNKELWKFEALYRGDLEGNSMFGDSMTGIIGLSEAYFHKFGEYPENFGQFPEAVYPPIPEPIDPPVIIDPPIIEEPEEPEEIIMKKKIVSFGKVIWDKYKWLIVSHLLVFILGIII